MNGLHETIRFSQVDEGVLEPDLDAREVERIKTQFDLLSPQVIGDTVAIALEVECVNDFETTPTRI